MEALRRFAALEIDVEALRTALIGVFEFELERSRRSSMTHFRMPEPGIAITRGHLSNALDKKRVGEISERELVYWATILLLNDAYVLDPGDEDLIAEWLNDISMNL